MCRSIIFVTNKRLSGCTFKIDKVCVDLLTWRQSNDLFRNFSFTEHSNQHFAAKLWINNQYRYEANIYHYINEIVYITHLCVWFECTNDCLYQCLISLESTYYLAIFESLFLQQFEWFLCTILQMSTFYRATINLSFCLKKVIELTSKAQYLNQLCSTLLSSMYAMIIACNQQTHPHTYTLVWMESINAPFWSTVVLKMSIIFSCCSYRNGVCKFNPCHYWSAYFVTFRFVFSRWNGWCMYWLQDLKFVLAITMYYFLK